MDAQRSQIDMVDALQSVGVGGGVKVELLGHLLGSCYTSKHPKRRSPKPKAFGAPRRVGCDADDYLDFLVKRREELGLQAADFLFPRTSAKRGQPFGSEGTVVLEGPAPSAEVIRRLRAMLQLPPLGLSAAEAAAFSGHSPRHFMVCFATAVASHFSPPRYSADELAVCGDWQEGMVARYSAETLAVRRLELLTRLLQDVDAVLQFAHSVGMDLPAAGGWADLAGLLASASDGVLKASKTSKAKRPAAPSGLLSHEDSSSGSDSDDE